MQEVLASHAVVIKIREVVGTASGKEAEGDEQYVVSKISGGVW